MRVCVPDAYSPWSSWNVCATGQAGVTTITAANAGTALLRFVRRHGWTSWQAYAHDMRRRLPINRLHLNITFVR
jgi:hypothetical protein